MVRNVDLASMVTSLTLLRHAYPFIIHALQETDLLEQTASLALQTSICKEVFVSPNAYPGPSLIGLWVGVLHVIGSASTATDLRLLTALLASQAMSSSRL